jgi:hypothetical protein
MGIAKALVNGVDGIPDLIGGVVRKLCRAEHDDLGDTGIVVLGGACEVEAIYVGYGL